MTSDAKIGLLLGLVFIFIIAFVVNGLPRLRSEPDSNELTVISAEGIVTSDSAVPGVGARERNADEVFRTWAPSERSEQQNNEPAREPLTAQADEINSPVVRFQATLPQGPPAVEDDITGGLTVPDASFVSNWIKRSASWVVQADKKTEPPKVLVDNSSTQKPTAEEQPTQTTQMVTAPKTIAREPEETTASQRTIIVPKPVNNEPVARNSEWPKTYVVTKGDNLAVIAKKFYGEELGNTRANIDILFKANTTTLESPDKIKVGQKLIIPLVPDLTQSAPQPANVFPKSLVETVPANKVDRIPPRNALIRVSDRYYVAKDGDSLWSIAAKELGKGTRYNEIFTLNSDIMKDPGNVVPGMRLKMPSQ